jgi:hypothetical protein
MEKFKSPTRNTARQHEKKICILKTVDFVDNAGFTNVRKKEGIPTGLR